MGKKRKINDHLNIEQLQTSLQMITKDILLRGDLVEDIYASEDDTIAREKMLMLCREKAEELRCKGDFNKIETSIKKAVRQALTDLKKDQEDKDRNTNNIFSYAGDSGELKTYRTGWWYVNMTDGVTRFNGDRCIRASRYPVIIRRRFRNRETGQEKLELCWMHDAYVRSITTNRGIAMNSRKIIDLADLGFPVTTNTAANMVSYLDDFEFFNSETIPLEVSSGKYGWLNENQFIPYTEDAFFDGTIECKSLVESIDEHGDLDKWIETVKTIRASGRKEPQVYMAAAFGSVLVPWLEIAPFIVNLYGVSGVGKTVCLMLCASIWGNPQGRGFIAESNSTLNSLELKLNVLNNLPLLVDDLSKIGGGEVAKLTDLIYTLCSGGGKGRATRSAQIRNTSTWSNIILTNMERPLTSDSMRGGAVNRVLDFQIDDEKIFADAAGVVEAVSNNYGHAGRMFVEAVQSIGRDGIREMVTRYREELVLNSGEAKEEKQILPTALLMAADEIAERFIFKDGVRLDMDYCISAMKSVDQVNELERAYQYLMDKTVANAIHFSDTSAEPWGLRNAVEDTVAYLPTELEAMLSDHADMKQFVRWLDKQGLLVPGDGRHKQKKIPGLNDRRCYVIKVDYDPEAPIRPIEEEDVPF